MNFRVSSMIVLLALLAAACGSPFVKGWRGDAENNNNLAPTCTAGYASINGVCTEEQKVLPLAQTEEECKKVSSGFWTGSDCQYKIKATRAQCATIDGWHWTDDEHGCLDEAAEACIIGKGWIWSNNLCIEPPALTIDGEQTQDLTAGVNFKPLDLKPSPNSVTSIKAQTCATVADVGGVKVPYFSIVGAQLVAIESALVPSGTKECQATIVASLNGVNTAEFTVVARFSRGFMDICSDPNATRSQKVSIVRIKESQGIYDCKALSDKLVNDSVLVVYNTDLADLSVLAGLANLKTLILPGNEIVDVAPIATLVNLETVDLGGNPITDLSPLKALTKLNIAILSMKGERTEANCPTGDDTPAQLQLFCKGPQEP